MNKGLARDGASMYDDPRAYAMVLPVLFTLPTQLTYLNKALRRFEAQFVVPAMQIFSTTASTFSGGLFFAEFEKYEVWQVLVFALGMLISFAGVLVLAGRPPSGIDEEEEGKEGGSKGPSPKKASPGKTSKEDAPVSLEGVQVVGDKAKVRPPSAKP